MLQMLACLYEVLQRVRVCCRLGLEYSDSISFPEEVRLLRPFPVGRRNGETFSHERLPQLGSAPASSIADITSRPLDPDHMT